MVIDVKGRNTPVTAELREYAERRFSKVSRQVSELARLEVELYEERNPSNPASQVAEITLYLKGITLRARECSHEMRHAIHLAEEDIARQVKRHRDKRRGPRAGQGLGSVPPDDLPVAEAI